jgi:hypothetical protein
MSFPNRSTALRVLACAVLMIVSSGSALAGTAFVEVQGYSRVQHKQVNWGTCPFGSDQAIRPVNPMTNGRADFSDITRAYAGYRTSVRRGDGPLPCNQSVDTTGDALFRVDPTKNADGTDLDAALVRDLRYTLRVAIFEITSFTSASPAGVASGPGTCGRDEVCPRNRPPSNCRFQLFAVPPPPGRLDFLPVLAPGTNREIRWQGAVSSIANPVQTPGRGYMLVSGTSERNGYAWNVTELARGWLSAPQNRRALFLTIADSEPSLQPEHRLKSIACDGFFTAKVRIDYNDR